MCIQVVLRNTHLRLRLARRQLRLSSNSSGLKTEMENAQVKIPMLDYMFQNGGIGLEWHGNV